MPSTSSSVKVVELGHVEHSMDVCESQPTALAKLLQPHELGLYDGLYHGHSSWDVILHLSYLKIQVWGWKLMGSIGKILMQRGSTLMIHNHQDEC